MTREGEGKNVHISPEARKPERIIRVLPSRREGGLRRFSDSQKRDTARGIDAVIRYFESGGKENVRVVMKLEGLDGNIHSESGYLAVRWEYGNDAEGSWKYPGTVFLNREKISKKMITEIRPIFQSQTAATSKMAEASSVRTSPFTHGRHPSDDADWGKK